MEVTNEVNDIIVSAYEVAKGNKDEFVTAEHLLYSITFQERFINVVSNLDGNVLSLRENLSNYINEYIEINVEDNGNGMSEDAINKIKEGLKKNIQKPNSIGLMNINNRLKLKFGDEYGIYINSRINEGTTVTVKIPLLGEEVDNV